MKATLLFLLVSLCIFHTSAVSIQNIMAHLEAFQAIADANGGNRAAQNPGYNASVDYVVSVLQSKTNYTVTKQPFNFEITQENAQPEFSQLSPAQEVYTRVLEFLVLSYSGSGDVQAVATDGKQNLFSFFFISFFSNYFFLDILSGGWLSCIIICWFSSRKYCYYCTRRL